VSAPTSRLASYMRDRLGPEVWNDFVEHTNRSYKAAFVRAFAQPVLHCVGRIDGTPCPHAFHVAFACADAGTKLAHLHLDHEQPLTCCQWTEQLSAQPRKSDNNVDGGALFGVFDDPVHGAKRLRFRCGPRRRATGDFVRFAEFSYCHTS
jgi:hypothetical protein